jgi:phage-related protein
MSATPQEMICFVRSGDGRWDCRYAGPWRAGYGKIRTDLPTKRTARVLVCLCRGHLVALHGFIKKTPATPIDDLEMARKRQKGLLR